MCELATNFLAQRVTSTRNLFFAYFDTQHNLTKMDYQACIGRAPGTISLLPLTNMSTKRIFQQIDTQFDLDAVALERRGPTTATYEVPPLADCLDEVDIILTIPNHALQCQGFVDEHGRCLPEAEGGQRRLVVADTYPRDQAEGVVRLGQRAICRKLTSDNQHIIGNTLWTSIIERIDLHSGVGNDRRVLSELSGEALTFCAAQMSISNHTDESQTAVLRCPFFSKCHPFPMFLARDTPLTVCVTFKSLSSAIMHQRDDSAVTAGFGSVTTTRVALPHDTPACAVDIATNHVQFPPLDGSHFRLSLRTTTSDFVAAEDRRLLMAQPFVFPLFQEQLVGECLGCSKDHPAEFDLTQSVVPMRKLWCSVKPNSPTTVDNGYMVERVNIEIMGRPRTNAAPDAFRSRLLHNTAVYDFVEFDSDDPDAVVCSDSRTPDLGMLPSATFVMQPTADAGKASICARALVDNRVVVHSGMVRLQKYREGDYKFGSPSDDSEDDLPEQEE
jgi:hypothetical protein